MNLFKKLFNWNRKERDEKLEELSKKLDVVIKHQENEKCVKNRIKVGTNTVIVFNDGNSLTCDDPDNTFYDYCGVETNRDYIDFAYNLHVNKEEKKQNEVISEKDFLILQNNPDFLINGNKVCLNGINIPIPDDILAEFVVNREEYLAKSSSFNMSDREELEKLDDYYNRLVFFWAKLANSPIQDRDNILSFCRNNDIRLSPLGNIVGYRNVVKLEKTTPKKRDINLQKFVEESIEKIKRWKKSPSNYIVYTSTNFEGYKITLEKDVSTRNFQSKNNSVLGKLVDLKEFNVEVEGQQLYTSKHNSGKYKFPIPSLYKMVDEAPDPNVGNCHSGGLHVGNVNFSFGGYGDTNVVCLINPAKTIFVPSGDTSKFRVSEMYLVCLNPNSHGVHVDESLIIEADKVYNQMTIDELKQAFSEKSMDILSIDEEHVPETTIEDVVNIIDILQNRVVKI